MANDTGFKHSVIEEEGGRRRSVFEFAAGATRYMETFENGRLVSQGWDAAGRQPPIARHGAWRDHPADGFQLVIDGRDTRRGWSLGRVETVDEAHGAVYLEHEQLPVTVVVHTTVAPHGVLAR